MLGDPTFRALGLASCLIATWFVAAPFPFHQPSSQTRLRHEWNHCADVVLVGDSSIAWGIHPEFVEAELTSPYRVVNFGYIAGSLADPAYMDAAEAVLDPTTPHRTMVMSITFADLGSVAASANTFGREAHEIEAARRDGHPPSVALDWRAELDLRLRPRTTCALLWNLCSWGTRHPLGYNGHLSPVTSWHDETFRIPDVLSDFNTDEPPYPPGATDMLFRRIGELRRRGVDVVGYVERNQPSIALITQAHGYDPDRLERELRASGAFVIDYPTDLTTFDGLHLDPPSQARFSRAIGRALAGRLPPRTNEPSDRCAWPLQTHNDSSRR